MFSICFFKGFKVFEPLVNNTLCTFLESVFKLAALDKLLEFFLCLIVIPVKGDGRHIPCGFLLRRCDTVVCVTAAVNRQSGGEKLKADA